MGTVRSVGEARWALLAREYRERLRRVEEKQAGVEEKIAGIRPVNRAMDTGTSKREVAEAVIRSLRS